MMESTAAETLVRAAAARAVSLSALSRMIGRNVAYLQQFVARGSPRQLPERERRLLADFLGVDEVLLGAPPREDAAGDVAVPWLTVTAAAGDGRYEDERVLRHHPIPRATLRRLGIAPANASLIGVTGDSMAPTLLNGDRLLVDGADRIVPRAGGVFVIRRDAGLAVKRLVPRGSGWEVRSDNPSWPAVAQDATQVAVIGRARLLLRNL